MLTLREHAGTIQSVAFGPDGHRLASASEDNMIRIRDATPEAPGSPARRRDLADRRWPVWQRREAEDCLSRGLWFAAAWHLERLVEREPDDADLRAKLALARERLQAERGPGPEPEPEPVPELPADVFAR